MRLPEGETLWTTLIFVVLVFIAVVLIWVYL